MRTTGWAGRAALAWLLVAGAWMRQAGAGEGLPSDLVSPDSLRPEWLAGPHFEPVGAVSVGCFTVDAMAKMGDVLFLVNGEESDGLVALDVKDPKNPRWLCGIPMPSFPTYLAFSADGSHAYVGARNQLVVVDVRDPADMRMVRILNYVWEASAGSTREMEVRGNALILQHKSGGGGCFSVLDISEPARPRLVRLLHPGEPVNLDGIPPFQGKAKPVIHAAGKEDFVIQEGNVEYRAIFENAPFAGHTHRLGVSIRVDGQEVYFLPIVGETRHLAKFGDYIYALGGYFRIIDVKDPAKPRIVGWVRPQFPDATEAGRGKPYYGTWIIPRAVTTNGKYAFCHDYGGDHIMLDVRDKARPVPVQRKWPGAMHSFWEGDVLYVYERTGGKGGMTIYDAADPANPRTLGRVDIPDAGDAGKDTSEHTHHIKVRDKRAYLTTARFGDLVVVDVGDKAAPKVLGRYDGAPYYNDYNTNEFAISGDHLYIPMAGSAGNDPEGPSAGIRVIDISDPANPKLAGHITPGDYVEPYKKALDQPACVNIVGNLMVVSDNWAGLKLFDITDWKNPKFCDIDWRRERYPASGHGMSMANVVDGDLVYTVTLGRVECHRIVRK